GSHRGHRRQRTGAQESLRRLGDSPAVGAQDDDPPAVTPAARRRHALASAVVELIVELVPDVDAETAAVAVAETAKTAPALRGLLEHLRSHLDALRSGSSEVPNAVIKLAHALH